MKKHDYQKIGLAAQSILLVIGINVVAPIFVLLASSSYL